MRGFVLKPLSSRGVQSQGQQRKQQFQRESGSGEESKATPLWPRQLQGEGRRRRSCCKCTGHNGYWQICQNSIPTDQNKVTFSWKLKSKISNLDAETFKGNDGSVLIARLAFMSRVIQWRNVFWDKGIKTEVTKERLRGWEPSWVGILQNRKGSTVAQRLAFPLHVPPQPNSHSLKTTPES